MVFIFKGANVSFLALSTTITSIIAFGIGLFIMGLRIGGFDRNELYLPALKIFVASTVMGLVLYLPLHVRFFDHYLVDYLVDTTRTLNLLVLTIGIGFIGLIVYLILTWWFKSDELFTFLRLLDKLKGWQRVFKVDETVGDPAKDNPSS